MAEKKTTKSKKNTKTTKKAEESSNQRQLYAILFFALGVIFTALALVGGSTFGSGCITRYSGFSDGAHTS